MPHASNRLSGGGQLTNDSRAYDNVPAHVQDALAGTHTLSLTERIILQWQWKLYGGFYTALLAAIAIADEENLERLARGFNDEVVAVRAWQTTWIGKSLRDRGLL